MKKVNEYDVKFYRTTKWNFKKEWRWRVRATNGEIVGASTEGFVNKSDCEHNARLVGMALGVMLPK
jgi:uncharacterized protein YegP (UPF0339 family)